jgi:AraC-like DNA-binding protein
MTRNVQVVVIAPVEVTVAVNATCRHSTIVFSSIAEFERWRVAHARLPATIAGFVREALILSAITVDATRPAVEWLCHRHAVPTVKELAATWSSRRSFFRAWKRDAAMSPHEFLLLVRTLHAESLLLHDITEKEAAKKSGFSTAAAMRRALDQLRPLGAPRAAAAGDSASLS